MTCSGPARSSPGAAARAVALGAMLICASPVVLAADAATIPLLGSRSVAVLAALADGPSMPTDVAAGPDGRVFVVEGARQRVAVYGRSGRREGTLGGPSGDEEALEDPVGVGVGPDGSVYVADRGKHRVAVFSTSGQFKASLPVRREGQPVAPIDVAVGSDGLLYVSCANHTVLVMDSSGTAKASWGGPGSEGGLFNYPATVAVDDEGSVYVVDVLNFRVQKFDAHGRFLLAFGQFGVTPGDLFRPKGVATGPGARVFVSDSYLGIVQAFDREGRFLYALGDDGRIRRWTTPVGLAFDPQGRLLVTEMLPGSVSINELEERP